MQQRQSGKHIFALPVNIGLLRREDFVLFSFLLALTPVWRALLVGEHIDINKFVYPGNMVKKI